MKKPFILLLCFWAFMIVNLKSQTISIESGVIKSSSKIISENGINSMPLIISLDYFKLGFFNLTSSVGAFQRGFKIDSKNYVNYYFINSYLNFQPFKSKIKPFISFGGQYEFANSNTIFYDYDNEVLQYNESNFSLISRIGLKTQLKKILLKAYCFYLLTPNGNTRYHNGNYKDLTYGFIIGLGYSF